MSMPNPLPEIGARYGHWTVIDNHQRVGKQAFRACKCRCDCGNVRIVANADLKFGRSTCCGCTRKNNIVPHNTGDGETRTRLYSKWYAMVRRCYDKNDKCYDKYGGRGISVCDEWFSDFQIFKSWALKNGYTDELTLDRIDVNGDYEPSNCRWATWIEQQNNKRNNRYLTFDGKTMTVANWAREIGINKRILYGRISLGWSTERILTQPPRKFRKENAL